MKISELSQQTGASVATIKYYLREGLLPAGERSAPNQATYDETHVRRIHMIRALTDVGGLSVSDAKRVTNAIDGELPLTRAFEIAQSTVSEHVQTESLDADALAAVDEAVAGWACGPDDPGRLAAARVVTTLRQAGQGAEAPWLKAYAQAAELVAEADLDLVDTRSDLASQAETVVVGTVLGDTLFAALRRSAQAAATIRRYGDPGRS
ncbi:MerR family transcriptional regulator [Salinibacterium sp. NG22]|uniref:MerR family transcriptional regulator n=1 Tax=Salinibacterium sp. NG22 TaxID=2792040 RepID=UPI0018CF8DAC|nr:MerR family transcriptional regulator [Salinibacterium sp. NG22]MBH0108636.1 MerR family transcriptional regulator [Salinibacterium sp. NG22]